MDRRRALATLSAGAVFGPLTLMRNMMPPAAAANQQPSQAGEYKPATFPLRVSDDRRYMEDAAGRPFLMVGDAAWSLIVQMKKEEVDPYLDARRQQGFNTLIVSLIEHKYSSNAPANVYGEPPFHAPGSFSEPNDRYFEHALWVLRRAQNFGFLVLLVPSFLGARGGDEGWYVEMKKAGPEPLHAYGRYVGTRCQELQNIIWVEGGDYDDPDKSLVRAVATGIAETDPDALHTVHSKRDTVTADYWRGENWLSIDTVYTYDDVFRAVSKEYERNLPLPILMIEALYENEHGVEEQRVRRQAYGAFLGGAAGHVYGNNPVWHFSGPGLFFSGLATMLFGWQHSLGSPGALSMSHLRRFFEGLEWWKIGPDRVGILLPSEEGYAVCGAAADSSFAVAYASGASKLRVRPGWKAPIEARWYDPTVGTFHEAAAPTGEAGDTVVFEVPASSNAKGFGDWLLLLRPRAERA